MAKKRRKNQSRDAPPATASASWLCSSDAFSVLLGDGYRKLSDCPEVKICVGLYADLISNMTLHLMANTERGDIRIKNGLSRKLDIAPAKYMTRKNFIYNLVWSMMLPGDGNQITVPTYSANGNIENLVQLPPSAISLIPKASGYEIRYGDKTLSPEEVLHFRINPDPEAPWRGTGYRAVLKDVVKGLRQAGAVKQKLMENPAPALIIRVDGVTEEFASSEGRAALRKQYLDAPGEPWFIPADTFSVESVKPLTLNDLAIKSNMEIDKKTAAGIFGVPPFFVGAGEYNKDEYNMFISTRIASVAQVIQQELTRGLLVSEEMYWHFNPRSLYAYSLEDIIKAGSEMTDRVAMRRNEWRDWIGLPPDAEMDELLALENYIPVAMLGKQKKLLGGDSNAK